MRRQTWAWVRIGAGVAILAFLLWRLGAAPFLAGLRVIDGWSLLAAAGITAVTTVCSAWRWNVVARGLGVRVPLGAGIRAYYRSQFLNSALPGGVVGDVHRGVRHGQDAGNVGRGLRAVAWERGAGQVVQVTITAGVLLVLDSPVRSAMPMLLLVAGGALLASAAVVAALPRHGRSWRARIGRAVRADVRHGLLARRAWPAVVLTSVVVVAGHTGVFLVAARAAGSTAPFPRLLPLALLVMLAMSVPLSIGGWGPREGVAAWAFGAVGLGASQGVAAATAYGVLAFAATLPGAVVLVVEGIRRRNGERPDESASGRQQPVLALAGPGGEEADG